MKTIQFEHSVISPTAKLVAYWRQFSDIPYAEKVAHLVGAESTLSRFTGQKGIAPKAMDWWAPFLEARYKSIAHIIKREGIKQVLDLASGVSFRGLAMSEDPEIIYVETDLPDLTREKLNLLNEIMPDGEWQNRKNLFFHAVNVLNFSELQTALSHFSKDKPIAIVHEGLFHYLTYEEKEIAARYFHAILSRYGGVWVTPDFTTKRHYESPLFNDTSMRQLTEAISEATQRDLRALAFDTEESIGHFLKRLGFSFKISRQIDGSYDLTSAKKMQVAPEVMSTLESELKVWTMRLA